MELRPRPRRSALYLPASNPRAIEKARSLPCDVVILDLEDSVAPDAKVEARRAAAEAVRAGGWGKREVVIRVNSPFTRWGAEDLAAAAWAAPDAVLVPKINTVGDVEFCNAALTPAPPTTRLWAMIETCEAVFHLKAIAASEHGSRLAAFTMGINDLAKEMRARMTPDRAGMIPFLVMAIAAARAHGLGILDGVHNEIDDLEALEAVCLQGAELGFDGKSVIHPSHLETCNRIFAPTGDELVWAKAVVAAFADPENAGRGVLRVEGRLAEHLHLDQCRQLLAVAEAIAVLEAG